MRNIVILSILTLVTLQLKGADRPSIIPVPSSYEIRSGHFTLNSGVRIYADDLFSSELHYLRNEILRYKGVPLMISEVEPGSGIALKYRAMDGGELYVLDINMNGVTIYSDSDVGAFYGAVSLIQLINSAEKSDGSFLLGCLLVKDSPVYSWRGIMLDESRHFFGVEKVKFILDWMAYYKLNKFHWHLTDSPGWRIEIKKYPKLGFVGGIGNHTNPFTPATFYTQEEILEIVSYAKERKITVIPEIDMPGHATAANRAYPEFSGGGSERFPDWTFHPAKEEVYQYLADILREVDVLFPSQMIHLGGDEVSFGNEAWKTDPYVLELMERENLQDLKAVEDYFMNRMADTLLKLNNSVLVWDEMSNAQLPRDQSIIFWWRHDQPEQLQMSLDNGHQTVICPRLPFYFDFVQNQEHRYGRKWGGRFNELHDVYGFSLSGLPVEEHQKELILGYQANVWTETIHNEERLDYMLFPRIAAIAESVWSVEQNKNYNSFTSVLEHHLNLFREYGIYFYNPFDENEHSEPALIIK